MNPTILGIDPGAKGAIAMVQPMVEVWDLPASAADLADLLRAIQGDHAAEVVFIERQWPRPGEGGPNAFKQGVGYGQILGVLAACRVPVREVTPQAWKKALGLSYEATDPKEKKERSRTLARQLFPEANVSRVDKAEALLIAEYGRRLG
jgi:hypothetical protein